MNSVIINKNNLLKDKNYSKNLISEILLLFLFCGYIFISNDKDIVRAPITVSHLNANKTAFMLFICIMATLLTGNVFFASDEVTNALILRAFIFYVICLLLYSLNIFSAEFQYGILVTYFICIMAYLWGRDFVVQKEICFLLFSCLVVILIQLVATFVIKNLSFSAVDDMKWWMKVPIGQTNTIGCYVMGMTLYICCSDVKKILKIFTLLLAFIILLFTYSRSGQLMFALYLVYILVKKLFSKKSVKTYIGILIAIFAFIVSIVFLNEKYGLLKRFDLNSLTDSRIKVYKESLILFFKNPFGIGAYKFHVFDADKAHNWILESLVQSGVLGTTFFILAIVYAYKKIKKNNQSFLPFIVFYLLHGLVEPNLFTVSSDVFFWLLVGTLQNKREYEL